MSWSALFIPVDITFASLSITKSISFGVTIILYPTGFIASINNDLKSSSFKVPIKPKRLFFSSISRLFLSILVLTIFNFSLDYPYYFSYNIYNFLNI